MPKPDIEYHVSLRSPIFVKLGDRLIAVRSFDATLTTVGHIDRRLSSGVLFVTDRLWPALGTGEIRDGVSFKATIEVIVDNIAGMVPQPFVER
jgi:hypothetical protein